MKNINPIKVLITSPSLIAESNIGGIASLTKLLLENNADVEYIVFERGKKDIERRGLFWLVRQPFVLLDFITTIINEKSIRIVHINMPLENNGIIRDSFMVLIASFFRKKIIVHFRGGKYSLNNEIPLHLRTLINVSILLSHKVITLGKKEEEFFIDHFNVNPKNIVFIPNAVKVSQSPPIKPKSSARILYLGRIDKNKGLKEIILALEQLKIKIDFKFIIAGDGPDKDDFIGECQRRIPDNYEYLGIISGEKKELVFFEANIFLLPSYYEGLPNALLEAMANKLVPIVTPVGSIPEVVKDDKNGFIVPIHNCEAIVDAIIQLNENPKKFEELSQNAYATIKLNYSLTSYIDKVNTLYSNLYPNIFNLKKSNFIDRNKS